jgi:ferric-dicitrate binding protein FerR (iron transport regulator)
MRPEFEHMTLGEIADQANAGDPDAREAWAEITEQSERWQAEYEDAQRKARKAEAEAERRADRRERAMLLMTAISCAAAGVAALAAILALVV